MNAQQVLQHLQSQYPGQLVLYTPQIACLLGKSEKALSHLVTRGRLPFTPKVVGGRKCVDVFQVAEWLAASSSDSQTPTPSPLAAQIKHPPSGNNSLPQKRNSLSTRLMELRHQANETLRRIAKNALIEDDSLVADFSVELGDEIKAFDDLTSAAFIVEAHWFLEQPTPTRYLMEGRWGFASIEEAIHHTSELQAKIETGGVISITKGREEVFRTSLAQHGKEWIDSVGSS